MCFTAVPIRLDNFHKVTALAAKKVGKSFIAIFERGKIERKE